MKFNEKSNTAPPCAPASKPDSETGTGQRNAIVIFDDGSAGEILVRPMWPFPPNAIWKAKADIPRYQSPQKEIICRADGTVRVVLEWAYPYDSGKLRAASGGARPIDPTASLLDKTEAELNDVYRYSANLVACLKLARRKLQSIVVGYEGRGDSVTAWDELSKRQQERIDAVIKLSIPQTPPGAKTGSQGGKD